MQKKPKKKKFKLNTKNWGINFDKNEFYEIVESNSANPERSANISATAQYERERGLRM